MLNRKQSNRFFEVGVVASLAASVVVVMGSLAAAISQMQSFV